jgi:hypothetical protein
MKSKYFEIIPYLSIICIILIFTFPVLRYRVTLNQYAYFWLWGWLYIPIIEGINILDITLKVISVWFIIELIYNIQSIYTLKKGKENIDLLSSKWFKWGIINLIVLLFCILWYFFIIYPILVTPFTITILDFSFYFLIAYSFLLIFLRYVYKNYVLYAEEKKDYTDLKWLKQQFYGLNRSIQDIADEQNTSIITIKKWVKKLENS